MDVVLTPVQVRVLGCLIEKEITTPEYYPLTLKALTAACNQKSNRDPVMTLDERAVLEAIDGLRQIDHMVWQVDTAGSRAPKYKHDVATALKLSAQELAVVCELMVRGPQTLGELRTHAGRLSAFGNLSEVADALQRLQARSEGPLVIKLPRETGRREQRYAHLLCGQAIAEAGLEMGPADPAVPQAQAGGDRLADIEAQVAALRKDVDELRQQLAEFKRQFA